MRLSGNKPQNFSGIQRFFQFGLQFVKKSVILLSRFYESQFCVSRTYAIQCFRAGVSARLQSTPTDIADVFAPV
ncbi:hypothetical protein C6495_17975 [Candidatus Poribacteria bacterium]|nr:MAG: hypothetical protein C6495_17975 [Candidatus Poribacteria bacterium]